MTNRIRNALLAVGSIAFLMTGLHFECHAEPIHIDPALAAMVESQTLIMQDIHKKRKKTQNALIAAEAAVTAAMDRVHSVEDKMLSYLKEAQSVMTNLYQIKRAAELVGKEIPRNLKELAKAVPSNWKGTAITALVSDETKEVYAEMSSLLPLMYELVTKGTYTVTDTDGSKKKHKVNLLDSSERYMIANEIVSRLENINIDIYLLTWQVKTYSWGQLWYGLDPDSYYAMVATKNIAENLIQDWKNLKY